MPLLLCGLQQKSALCMRSEPMKSGRCDTMSFAHATSVPKPKGSLNGS